MRAAARSPWALGLWVVVFTLAVVPLVYGTTVQLGPGTVEVDVRPATSGSTRLALPPLGAIAAPTHAAPARVDLELREIDVLEAIETEAGPGGLTAQDARPLVEAAIRDDLGAALFTLGWTLALTAASCGLVAAAAFPGRRSWRRLLAGAGIGAASVAVLVVPVASSFDPDAFVTEPELSGQLGSAEQLLNRVGTLETPFGSVGSRTRVLSERLAGLYSATITDRIARAEGEVVLLHVSDLHLNPVGLSLARELAESFDVDAVLDTGDITSFGFEPEADFTEQLAGIDVPYYLVPGNHDSEAVRRRLAASDDVVLLDDDVVDVEGVRVLGVADPTVTALRRIPRDELDETYRGQFERTTRLVERERPDLLAVHNPVQARPVIGEVGAVAAGHLHRSEIEVADGTVIAVVGSSGATGVGNLLVDESEPYRFQLLRFVDGELVAVDQLELRGAGGDLRLDRRLIDPDEPDAAEPSLTDEEVQEPSREEVGPDELDRVTSSTTSTAGLLDERDDPGRPGG